MIPITYFYYLPILCRAFEEYCDVRHKLIVNSEVSDLLSNIISFLSIRARDLSLFLILLTGERLLGTRGGRYFVGAFLPFEKEARLGLL